MGTLTESSGYWRILWDFVYAVIVGLLLRNLR